MTLTINREFLREAERSIRPIISLIAPEWTLIELLDANRLEATFAIGEDEIELVIALRESGVSLTYRRAGTSVSARTDWLTCPAVKKKMDGVSENAPCSQSDGARICFTTTMSEVIHLNGPCRDVMLRSIKLAEAKRNKMIRILEELIETETETWR